MSTSQPGYFSYGDEHPVVKFGLECGRTLGNIALDTLNTVIGDRDAQSALLKLFDLINEQLQRGGTIDTAKLSVADLDALRKLVGDIVARQKLYAHGEPIEQAIIHLLLQHEANMMTKDDIISDLEGQVAELSGRCGVQELEANARNFQLALYEGRVESLNGTIALLTMWMPALADGLPTAQNLPTNYLAALQSLRVARIGPALTAEMAAQGFEATTVPLDKRP